MFGGWLFPPPSCPKLSKICAPSVKKGRFSEKKVSKAVRLITAGSSSTWPKSGFTVASSVKLLLTPHLMSSPALEKARNPSLNGLPGASGCTSSVRPTT
jgi:hypothetical protein